MNVDNVERRLKQIGDMARDPEAAHALEDRLWLDVLVAVGAGSPEAQELATAALRSTNIEFPRYCS